MLIRIASPLALALALFSAGPLYAAGGKGERLTWTTSSPEARAAFERGRDHFENHHNKEAEAELRKAVALDPNFASAESYLAMQTRGEEGLRLARQAQTHSAALPLPERLLIRAHLEQLEGKDRDARATLREAMQAAPEEWRLAYYAGRMASLDRMSGLALVLMRKTLQLNPQAAPAWNVYGYLLANQGDYAGGIEALKNYEKLLPKDPNPPDSLAEIYLRAGRLDEADKAYGRSAERAPDATNAYLGQAEVRFLRGDYGAGLQSAMKAREGAPVFSERQQAERMIAWGTLASGKPAEALKKIQEAEALARKKGASFARLLALSCEARLRIETGDASGAFARAKEALAAIPGAQMAGNQADTVEERAQVALLLAAVKLGKLADADAALAALQSLHKKLPERGSVLVATHLGAGALAQARGNARAAVSELSRCSDVDAYCAWQLLSAQRAAGDGAAAAAGERALLARTAVEQVYLDDDPLLIYVHAQLAAGPRH